jgi:hypothetical protein
LRDQAALWALRSRSNNSRPGFLCAADGISVDKKTIEGKLIKITFGAERHGIKRLRSKEWKYFTA